jgi:hypothetical protein
MTPLSSEVELSSLEELLDRILGPAIAAVFSSADIPILDRIEVRRKVSGAFSRPIQSPF